MLHANAITQTSSAVPRTSPHVISEHGSEAHQVLDPGINLFLLRRPRQPSVASELLSLRPSDLPDLRRRTSPETFDDDVSVLLTERGLDPESFEHWRADLRQVAELFFGVSGGRATTLRLETTDTDGCRRFHVDRTHLRLLCTYRGPGTEWLTDDQVDRRAQRNGSPNEQILRFGEPSRFEPFWIGILKGEIYPGNAGRGLVHRSPPLTGSGQTRVLVCLDC
jgi:hypothetical protein